MSLTMVAMLIAVLCGVLLVLRLLRPANDDSIKPNRYSRKQRKSDPSVSYSSLPTSAMDNMTDEVLDLKQKKAPSYFHEKTQPIVVQPTLDEQSEIPRDNCPPSEPPVPVITFYLIAKQNRPYTGYELLQSILASGLRYGRMSLFHRYANSNGQGDVLFSLASATAPGTFDLAKMGGFSTTGLALFFKIDKVADPFAAYEMMLQTAGQLVEDLGGQVLDDSQNVLTPQTVIKTREQLRACLSTQALV